MSKNTKYYLVPPHCQSLFFSKAPHEEIYYLYYELKSEKWREREREREKEIWSLRKVYVVMIVGKCKTLSAIVNINVNSLNDLFLQSNYLQFVISKQPAT